MTYNGTPTRYFEPPLTRTHSGHRGATENRWRWWYSAISDLMIRHPDWTQQEIATKLNKHPNTISMIVGTDLFKEFLAQRKAAWMEDHDHALRSRLTEVATEGLDIVLEQLRTKKSAVPLQAALKITESALDRLGYAPSNGPQVVVNNAPDNRQQTLVALTPADLEAARQAMRMAEQAKSGSANTLVPPSAQDAVLEACVEGTDAQSGVVVLDGDSP